MPESSGNEKYKDLEGLDEPPILKHGGKLVRDYVAEALHKEKDYDFAALLMNCVTNAAFKLLFKFARSGDLGVCPEWATTDAEAFEANSPFSGNNDSGIPGKRVYAGTTMRVIKRLHESGKGLASLISAEAIPTDLRNCGITRLQDGLTALKKHPTLGYVLEGIGEIATLNLEIFNDDMFRKIFPSFPHVPPAKDRRSLSKLAKRKMLITRLEDAVFTGDLVWIKGRYGHKVVKNEDDQDDQDDSESSNSMEE